LPAVEVGWRLARPAWGRGLATEGARASLRHAFGELDLEAVISIIDPANLRSIRVAEKLGMRRGAGHVHPRSRRRLLAYEISSHDAAFSPGPP
jgi:RimJ/RimL family protein N-acetyltransferase